MDVKAVSSVQLQRLKVLKVALGSQRLEGLEPPLEALRLGQEWAQQRITIAEAINAFKKHVSGRGDKL